MNTKRYTNLSTQRHFYHKFVQYGNRLYYEIQVSMRYTFVQKGLFKQISITFQCIILTPSFFPDSGNTIKRSLGRRDVCYKK